jgi:hypothetical protein
MNPSLKIKNQQAPSILVLVFNDNGYYSIGFHNNVDVPSDAGTKQGILQKGISPVFLRLNAIG